MVDIWTGPGFGGTGRKYGLGKYGRNTYDHFRKTDIWAPIPIDPPGERWVPIPAAPPIEIWTGSSTFNQTERWVPIVEPSTPWTPSV